MPAPLSGPGVGLQLPQNLYPTELANAPFDFSNPNISLAPGDAIPLPAGTWYLDLGLYSVLQYLDPVTGVAIVVRSRDAAPPKAQQLKTALTAARIGAQLVSDPALPADAAMLWIGRRQVFMKADAAKP